MPAARGPKEFWAKVDKSGDCWIFNGAHDPLGYGYVRRTAIASHMLKAHRYSWMLLKGQIPEGLCVLHRCDNPPCVNPEHLFLGTIQDNNQDKVQKGRSSRITRNSGESHGARILSNVIVKEMRALHFSGVKQAVIAKQFNVSTKTVWYALRIGWRHVA
jgi:hypothetical protein